MSRQAYDVSYQAFTLYGVEQLTVQSPLFMKMSRHVEQVAFKKDEWLLVTRL